MKNQNKNLHSAKKNKNDEFYTRLSDIEKELQFYKHHFKDKTVYCNCDDPRVSNFFRFFSLKFQDFELKKLIASCYKNQNPDLFSQNKINEKAIYLEYKRDTNGTLPYFDYIKKMGIKPFFEPNHARNNPNVPQPEDIGIGIFKGNGDFRNEESIDLLKKADIVVTNPPFSLFREYIAQLIKYNKKFIIIGNMNALKYQEIFPLIKENKIWLGHKAMGKDMLFDTTKEHKKYLIENKKEGSGYKKIDGEIKARASGIWYTNLPHKKRNEELFLYEEYQEKKYPKYDNYEAININKTSEIPKDYEGVMGVPISFMDKYNPEQFEIIGYSRMHRDGSLDYLKNPKWQDSFGDVFLQGKQLYARIFIKIKK